MKTVFDVAELISKLGCGAKGTHLLFFENEELQLRHRLTNPHILTPFTDADGEDIPKYLTITQRQIREGLTCREWDRVANWLIRMQE